MESTVNDSVINRSFWDFKGQEEFVDDWYLMSTPLPNILITLGYLSFVLKIGPNVMEKRRAINLNAVLLMYNTVQVLVSAYVFVFGFRLLWARGLVYSECQISNEETKKLATGMYYYFACKVSELLDTIFFVLRKKNNQVSFLHVYHHCLMMWTSWLALKYEPTYTTTFLGTLNTFVHIVMYTYYGLSTFPSIAKFLWWKKYITKLQLIQFAVIILQALANYAYTTCKPSYMLLYCILFNAALFIYLFGDFYVKAYLKNQREKKEKSLNEKSNGTSTEKTEKLFTAAITINHKLPEKIQ